MHADGICIVIDNPAMNQTAGRSCDEPKASSAGKSGHDEEHADPRQYRKPLTNKACPPIELRS
jgi:hypothetical protein